MTAHSDDHTEEDKRNVLDRYKHWSHEAIVDDLNKHGVELEVAVENIVRDFNMGTIVRSANAFGVRTVHVIGKKQWNKRGAMATDKYVTLRYHDSVDDFVADALERNKYIIAVDTVWEASKLGNTKIPMSAILVFGAEGPGLSDEMIAKSHDTIAIEQRGSTRSINVGVAAGIVMYEWMRQHVLTE